MREEHLDRETHETNESRENVLSGCRPRAGGLSAHVTAVQVAAFAQPDAVEAQHGVVAYIGRRSQTGWSRRGRRRRGFSRGGRWRGGGLRRLGFS
jgi:hypothetical protein